MIWKGLAYVVINVLLGFSVDQVEHYKPILAELTRIEHMFLMSKVYVFDRIYIIINDKKIKYQILL